MKLVLFNYWRSSASYRVRIGLHHKGLSFEYVPVNLLAGEQRTDAHRARNPSGYVPALDVDGRLFFESIPILELLDEIAPERPLLPKDPFLRARVRAFVEIVNSGIQPLHNLNVLQHLSSDEHVRADWSRHFIQKGFASLERALEAGEREGTSGAFAFGDAFTLADVVLPPAIYGAKRYDVDLAPYPRLARYGKSALDLPEVQAAIPERQPDAPKG